MNGLRWIVAATAVGGVAGYFVTWYVPRVVGFAGYAPFAVFWSYLFLVSGALTGFQQEVTRATRVAAPDHGGHHGRAARFAIAGAVVAAVALACTAPLWAERVFAADGWSLVWPLVVGAGAFVALMVFSGSLYGVGAWRVIFGLAAVEHGSRIAFVLAASRWWSGTVPLAWAVALPFPVALAALWPFGRPLLVGRTSMDVAGRTLWWNVARTVVAAGAMSATTSGFPLLLATALPDAPKDQLGMLVIAATFTRAPLIVVAMALQSFLLLLFRERFGALGRTYATVLAVVAGGGVALALGATWLGPPVFALLFPGELVPDGTLLATLAASATLLAALFVSAAAVLARGSHVAYAAGWVAACVVTVVALVALPGLFDAATAALLLGPAAGLVVHGGALYALRGGPAA